HLCGIKPAGSIGPDAQSSGSNGLNCFCTGAAAIKNRKSKIENEESHSTCRRCRDASFSAHEDRLQTASPALRQTNGLLSAGHAHARRSTGGADHYHTKGFTDAARLSGRRHAT